MVRVWSDCIGHNVVSVVLIGRHWCDALQQTLFESALSVEQVVDHVGRHTDEGGHADAVAQDSGPGRIVVVEQLHIRREGKKADDDEQEKAGTDGDPTNSPEPSRIETKHDMHVIAETIGTIKPGDSDDLQ